VVEKVVVVVFLEVIWSKTKLLDIVKKYLIHLPLLDAPKVSKEL
jgi:hypothetical protein